LLDAARLSIVPAAIRGVRQSLLLALAAAAALLACLFVAATPASAAGGGLKPSEAPLIEIGKPYFGTTAADNQRVQTEYWRLPALQAQDVITLAWHNKGDNRVCLVQNVDDYNYTETDCASSYYNTSSGSARDTIEVPSASSASFLTFWVWGGTSSGGASYDFVVETIQHKIGVSLAQVAAVQPNATLQGYAGLTDGTPAPDGLVFTLTVRWKNASKIVQTAKYSAASTAGALSFPLALPPSAQGRNARLVISRPADAQYLAVKSTALKVLVTPASRHHRHKCKKGFKKHKVHGKARCVKIKHRKAAQGRGRFAALTAMAAATGTSAVTPARAAGSTGDTTHVDNDSPINGGHHGHYPSTKFYNQICSDNATNRPSSRYFIPNSSRYANQHSNRWKIRFGEDAFQACSNMGIRKISYFQQIKNPDTGEWRQFTHTRSIKSNELFELYGSYNEPILCRGAEDKPFPNVRTVLRARWIPLKSNTNGVPAMRDWYQRTIEAHCANSSTATTTDFTRGS
jgi:hypothetical protein